MNLNYFTSIINQTTSRISGGRSYYIRRPRFIGDNYIDFIPSEGDSKYFLGEKYLGDEQKWNVIDDFISPTKEMALRKNRVIELPLNITTQLSVRTKVL